MPFTYLLGNPSAPRGHALLLLRSERGDPGVWATYLVVTPITMDFTKYLPPMFASFAAMAPQSAAAAVPMPPIPERLDSEVAVRRLAEARGDDLLDGGAVDTQAVDRLMLVTAEAAQRYHDAYVAYLRTVPETPAVVAQEVQSLSADELTAFQALTEGEQLSELSKLVGKLRYAVSGHDIYHAAEARRQITALASLLSPKYRIDDLLGAAQRDDATADRLTELYLERCFKILHEEYEQLPALEARIKELSRSEGGPA